MHEVVSAHDHVTCRRLQGAISACGVLMTSDYHHRLMLF